MEYDDPQCAERAMQTLNGRRVHQQEIRVNWAYQSNNTAKEDTSNHFHIFVGDLCNEVNDEVLLQAFSAFGGVSEARVMWDMKTGRSRGYGFVSFREREEAEKALSAMDGEWLGSRAIRCNWANQKGQPSYAQQQAMVQMGMTPTTPYGHHSFPTQGAQSYEMVVQQTPQWQTTAYVGNLTPYTTQNDLVPLFQNFGYVTETRFQSDRGFAFVKMDTHENAAMAICQLSGYQVNGRPLKCSWGKDRPQTPAGFEGFSPTNPPSAMGPAPQAFFPQYGQPSPMSPQGQFFAPPPPRSRHLLSADFCSSWHADESVPPCRSGDLESANAAAKRRSPPSSARKLAPGRWHGSDAPLCRLRRSSGALWPRLRWSARWRLSGLAVGQIMPRVLTFYPTVVSAPPPLLQRGGCSSLSGPFRLSQLFIHRLCRSAVSLNRGLLVGMNFCSWRFPICFFHASPSASDVYPRAVLA